MSSGTRNVADMTASPRLWHDLTDIPSPLTLSLHLQAFLSFTNLTSPGDESTSKATNGNMDGLTLLRRQYYALCPAYLLSVPTPSTLASEEGHDTLLSLLNDDPPAPEREYARQFWRRVLPALEKGVMLGEGVEEVSRSSPLICVFPPSFHTTIRLSRLMHSTQLSSKEIELRGVTQGDTGSASIAPTVANARSTSGSTKPSPFSP